MIGCLEQAPWDTQRRLQGEPGLVGEGDTMWNVHRLLWLSFKSQQTVRAVNSELGKSSVSCNQSWGAPTAESCVSPHVSSKNGIVLLVKVSLAISIHPLVIFIKAQSVEVSWHWPLTERFWVPKGSLEALESGFSGQDVFELCCLSVSQADFELS